MNTYKSNGQGDSSNSIVVSFHSKWKDLVLDKSVKAFLRKRGPAALKPEWVYVYVSAPISTIVGRMSIQGVSETSLSDCLLLQKETLLSSEEVCQYAENYKSLFVFNVNNTQIAKKELSLQSLNKHAKFSPPQSFLVLSEDGKSLIDELCGF